MVKLYLVRHGETEENVARLLQGHLPGRLTPLGLQQAQALRDRLADRHFDILLCSDLERTLRTAHILSEAVGLAPRPTALLRERDWGELTGKRIADVDLLHFPPSVETVEQMAGRARRFLGEVTRRYDGQEVLAVTHGLFARCLLACHEGKTIRDIPPMQNAEIRLVLLGR